MKHNIKNIALAATMAMLMSAMPTQHTNAGWWKRLWDAFWNAPNCTTNDYRLGLCPEANQRKAEQRAQAILLTDVLRMIN